VPIFFFAVVYTTAAVAGAGVLHALLVLNARRVVLTVVGLGLYMASWVIVGVRGWADGGMLEAMVLAHLWILTLSAFFGTAFLFRRTIAEGVCTARGLVWLLVIGTGFLAMTLWLNPNPDDIEDHLIAFMFGFLPLTAAALSPWTFGRLRHR
jgi:hypothetical protein